jgi:hypothetical protein
MLGKYLARLPKFPWEKAAARTGAWLSGHKAAIRGAGFAAGFALVVLLIHREVYSYITARRQFSVPKIQTALAPSWADSQGVEVVRIDTQGVSLFDETLVERVGRAFEACPWIRKVTSVERVFPDQLRVRFEYRKAAVAVRRPNGHVLVDSEGVRLPGVYVDPPRCEQNAVVTGVASNPPEPGRIWDDPALRAGMDLAAFSVRSPVLRPLGIREVDVSNFGGRQDARRSELALVTSGGCQLQWGRSGPAPRYGDLSTEEKLEHLREVLAVYPDLNGLRCVKLYFKGSRAVELHEGIIKKPAR